MKQASVYWFTGLSGAGKTTVATLAKKILEEKGLRVRVVDGDEVRAQYGFSIGFSEEDIKKNNQYVASHCGKIRSEWDVILVPIISPYRESRQTARHLLGHGFYEVYLSASLDTVVARDTKGLYRKAREGQIDNLIGFSAKNPYEAPTAPDLTLNTEAEPPERSARKLCQFIGERLDARIS